jgi:hypothetical protein
MLSSPRAAQASFMNGAHRINAVPLTEENRLETKVSWSRGQDSQARPCLYLGLGGVALPSLFFPSYLPGADP